MCVKKNSRGANRDLEGKKNQTENKMNCQANGEKKK